MIRTDSMSRSDSGSASAGLAFDKMHGLGNDFVVVLLDDLLPFQSLTEALKKGIDPLSALAKRLCDRNFGIGADGLIVGYSLKNTPAIDAGILNALGAGYAIGAKCDIGWIYINSDGSYSAMCGNGLRCLGLWALRKKLVASNRILVSTKAGVQEILVEDESKITVDMGKPILQTELIPLNTPKAASFVQGELNSPDFEFKATCVSMGNPHVIIFDAPQAQDSLSEMKFSDSLKKLSILVQQHKLFPEGVNVEWCRAVCRNEVHSLIYERGCGATLACASGAAAVVVAGVLEGRIDRKAKIRLPGGYLSIEWAQSDEHVHMSGPAATSFSGSIGFDALDSILSLGGQSVSKEIFCS
ncbi:MAG: diaminopimelate epimerase [Candidatus Melainabacteria bacterium]|nr:diaminopimelate epimerase [Candidatus Melainabacteria bacterium]